MSAAAEEEVPGYRLYNSTQGAQRVGGIRASTLARLARHRLVPHTRNGRIVLWTEEQLAGAVAYLATERSMPKPPSSRSPAKRSAEPTPRGAIAPLVSRPGSRYGTPATP